FPSAQLLGPGVLELSITPETKTLVLRTSGCVWLVRIGRLDTLPSTARDDILDSVVQRLVGLGLLASMCRFQGDDADCVREAIAALQAEYMDLDEPTGVLDDATLADRDPQAEA
ncbi:MAG: hypothetical protein U0230_27965, partial [Polyangiales bacterium]